MSSSLQNTHRLFLRSRQIKSSLHHQYCTTPALAAMKPGTPIPGLDAIHPKNAKDPSSAAPTALPRSEYPSWINTLSQSPPTLAKLRTQFEKVNFETDVDVKSKDFKTKDWEMKRFLKLVRRGVIKENNMVAGG